ncbi:MAG: hypothetical protein K0R92_3323, partial [Lachnospiraceae bacterium]|nr:hypothetical protein [Lachnospiraceae bacterium]
IIKKEISKSVPLRKGVYTTFAMRIYAMHL